MKRKSTPARGKKRASNSGNVKSENSLIDARKLVEALEQHVLGEKEMTATQVNAALALLKKILPDVSDPAKKPARGRDAEETGDARHEDALQDLE